MQSSSTHSFETALGWIGIAWNDRGLTRLFLPDRREKVERRLAALAAVSAKNSAPNATIEGVIDAIRSYAAGELVEFSDVAVDFSGVDAFRHAIYRVARELKFGDISTYGELAGRAGYPGLARETGQALGSNPLPLIVPCHRILAAGGKIGGFSAPGGAATKEKMLTLEGVRVGRPEPAQQAFGF